MLTKRLTGILIASGFVLLGAATSDPVPHLTTQDEAKQDVPQYVGADSCKLCHFKQHKSWTKTTMAASFDVLKPGNAKEIKEKHGLDTTKDYSKDASCLPCHTTGYGQPGGYPAIDPDKPWTKEQTELASKREGVQCESCHGPSSQMMEFKKELKKSKAKYEIAELQKLGLVVPDKDNCATCHNDKSPTHPKGEKIDFEKLLKNDKQVHDHMPLRQRRD